MDRIGQGNVRTGRPLEDLLGPVHAQETVHFALANQLQLGRIPQIVVGVRLLQLLTRVDPFAFVLSVEGTNIESGILNTIVKHTHL